MRSKTVHMRVAKEFKIVIDKQLERDISRGLKTNYVDLTRRIAFDLHRKKESKHY